MQIVAGSGLVCLLCVGGCLSRGNVDLLEARLRQQEDQLRSLQAQTDRAQTELDAARRLNESLSRRLPSADGSIVPAEHLEQQFRVKEMRINSLLTGGFDRDGQPGDDQLTLQFSVIDNLGAPIQLPGTVKCQIFDPSRSEGPLIGEWSFDEKQTRSAWVSVLGQPGFRFELPWQTRPASPDLEVRIRFRSVHGDEFETSGAVQVTLPTSQ